MEVKVFDDIQPSSFLVIQNTNSIKAIASGICLSIISKQNQFHVYIYVNMCKYYCTFLNLNSLKAFQKTYLIYAVSIVMKQNFKINQIASNLTNGMTLREGNPNDSVLFDTVPMICR